jgi:Ca-activated chloride channel family protein
MTVAHPAYLLAGAIVIATLAWLYLVAERRTASQALAYSNLAFFLEATQPRAWIPNALRAAWIVALALVALAAAGPRATVPVPARDGSVFICIDTSGSMQSSDVQPTREEAAKAAARAFITEAPPGIKVGLVSFSTQAAVVAPLTADHDRAIAALDDVPNPNGGTAIGDALRVAGASLPVRGHRVVVLITDGVNNAGADPANIAHDLGVHHIPVYTIGIGTANGDVIPGTNEQASIDEDALRSYAQASGGAYARAENAAQLRDALARLGRISSLESNRIDLSGPAAIGGALLLAATFLTGFALGKYQ